MISPAQPDLFAVAPADPNVEWFVAFLEGKDWTPAAEVLAAAGRAVTEDNKRWLRALRRASAGRIAGGPGAPGYKLVAEMTGEEYQHWRNAMKRQADEMLAGILEADRVFYRRQAVPEGRGILG